MMTGVINARILSATSAPDGHSAPGCGVRARSLAPAIRRFPTIRRPVWQSLHVPGVWQTAEPRAGTRAITLRSVRRPASRILPPSTLLPAPLYPTALHPPRQRTGRRRRSHYDGLIIGRSARLIPTEWKHANLRRGRHGQVKFIDSIDALWPSFGGVIDHFLRTPERGQAK